jgi:short-subunit dehydrogenase
MAERSYKTALITGASSGLGRGLALWLARRGTHVFAAARRKENLQALADEARAAGATVEPVEMDVARAEESIARIQQIDTDCGGLDMVVANAGMGLETSAKRIAWERVKPMLEVNVTGAAATLSAVLPRMVERNRGHLVGVSSLAAWRGLPRNAVYSASKAFLSTFLESLRVDLKRTAVRVTCIHPGFVKSEMTAVNKFRMPFLMETADAVELMGKGILAGKPVVAFPWQMSTSMRLIRAMPDPLFDLVARKMR